MRQSKYNLFLFFKKPNFALVFLLVFLLSPVLSQAAMISENYIIHENAMHVFDGPIISGISHTVSEQTATVTWNTDQISDAFVEYDTDSGFSASKEQGSTLQNSFNHTVAVSGLEPGTTYYYRVKSRRLNGGVTVQTPAGNTFTSEALPIPEEETTTSSGGGLLIIDKTDKTPPLISEVEVKILDGGEVEISWITDEDATSFVEYGLSEEYGGIYGHWNMSDAHSVLLSGLQAGARYNFRALSSDDWGNVGYSENFVFSLREGVIEEPELIPEEPVEEPGAVETTIENLLDFIRRIFPEVSLNNTQPNPLADVDSLDDLKNLAPIPVLSGEPRVEIGAEQVTVYWVSDIESDSRVALAPEDDYRAEASEPYRQIIGTTDVFSLNHEVTLYNLTPDTTYHFQLRSQPQFGPEARSRDFTFRTSLEELRISNFFYQVIDEQTAVFKWVTNKNSDSAITYTPYLGDRLAAELMKTVRKNEETVIHEIEISEFMGGVKYNVTIASADDQGNRTTETFPDFSTSPDDSPPIVSHIKADSTVFLDRNNKTQTIISWRTNEPATSRIFYQEGVHGTATDLDESTELNENYTKEHVVVITKFRPGVVYTFRVESTDSGGNTVLSKPHTFMTAKTKESIFQIIMNILENTFGWIKDIM